MKPVLFILLLFALAGCSLKPLAVPPSGESEGAAVHRVYVVNHGWHTGFGVKRGVNS